MGTPYLPSNTQIGKYLVDEFLGNGAFGSVFRVLNCDGQQFALKCLYKYRFSEANGKVGELAYNELLALKSIKNEYVIKLVDSFETTYKSNTLFCMVLEYCDGGDLQEYLEKNWSQFRQEDAIRLFQQILSAMKELHQQRIVHRDLKLPNILMHQGKIKIADFGFCHIFTDQQSKIKLNLGSLGTSAPEVLNNESYGLKSDMFSIGVIFYLMLFCKYPFCPFSRDQFFSDVEHKNPPSFNENGRKIDGYLEQILTEMLKYDSSKRLEWSKLFRTKLFEGKISQIFISSHIQVEQDIVDPIQSYIFYKRQQFLESTPLIVEKNSISEKAISISEETKPIQTSNYIQVLFKVYELINKINHQVLLASLLPSYLILKLIFSKQLQQIDFNKQSSNKLTQSGNDNYLDLQTTHINLTYQQQVVWANQNKLQAKHLINDCYIPEIQSIKITKNFLSIFQQVMQNYKTSIYQEVDKDCVRNQITIQNLLPESNFNTESQNRQVLAIIEKAKLAVLIDKIQQDKDMSQYELEQIDDHLIIINHYINQQS